MCYHTFHFGHYLFPLPLILRKDEVITTVCITVEQILRLQIYLICYLNYSYSHLSQFTETLILEANNQEHHNLRFSIYDTENLTSKDLHKHQLIGSVEVELFRLLDNTSNRTGSIDNNNKENHEKCFHLQFQGQAKKRGKIFIDAEQVDQSSTNTNVKLCLSAVKLSRKGLNIFGKCDAYFEIERKLYNETYHPIYRSEVVFRTSDPRQVGFFIL